LALLIVDATFSVLPALEAAGARAARIFISALALPVAVPTGCCAVAFALGARDLTLVDLEAAADAAADFAAAAVPAGVAELLRGAAASGLAGRPGALWLLLTLLLLSDPGLLLLLLLLGSFLTTCRMQSAQRVALSCSELGFCTPLAIVHGEVWLHATILEPRGYLCCWHQYCATVC
jgi:hypothetical protein